MSDDKVYVLVRRVRDRDKWAGVEAGYELLVSEGVKGLPSPDADDSIVTGIEPKDKGSKESDLWPRGPWQARLRPDRGVREGVVYLD